MKTRIEYEREIDNLLDDALNDLSPESYHLLLDNIIMMAEERQESE